MTQKIDIGRLSCLCSVYGSNSRIAYILYPLDILSDWIEDASNRYATTIIVITGMDWESAFSPWPAKGVPKGSPDFKGESAEFLATLRNEVLPRIDTQIGVEAKAERTLIGVSMSGLFALWQWMNCDLFSNIASLSGSFWYEGFIEWIKNIVIPHKSGKAFFLLGKQEPKSNIKAFDCVGVNTQEIISLLSDAGIDTQFKSVPGNHYSDPIPRLNATFKAIFGQP